jgi:DNA-binding CsgD family transcriptional regulator
LSPAASARPEIARDLGIRERTVDKHVTRIKLKLGARTRALAVALAVHRRIVDVGG